MLVGGHPLHELFRKLHKAGWLSRLGADIRSELALTCHEDQGERERRESGQAPAASGEQGAAQPDAIACRDEVAPWILGVTPGGLRRLGPRSLGIRTPSVGARGTVFQSGATRQGARQPAQRRAVRRTTPAMRATHLDASRATDLPTAGIVHSVVLGRPGHIGQRLILPLSRRVHPCGGSLP